MKPATGRLTMADAERIETVSWENGSKKKGRLAEREAWRNYPANLLRARAIANGARMIGPDLLAGMSYTPEELGAAVDEEGTPRPMEPEVSGTGGRSNARPDSARRPKPSLLGSSDA